MALWIVVNSRFQLDTGVHCSGRIYTPAGTITGFAGHRMEVRGSQFEVEGFALNDPALAPSSRRSEQHDDKLFFEILRCIKGLTTSDVCRISGLPCIVD